MSHPADRPVGVFDSGVGGLTVVRCIAERLPQEEILYFGDTARLPYGPKSPATVRRYAREAAAFLLDNGIKALVVACNTATAHALDTLAAELPVPVLGVIGPGARAAVRATRSGRIGVIGTAGTIASGAYTRAVRRLLPGARVHARACPLLVPLVEEGLAEHPATRLIAQDCLGPLREAGIDVLILGCTHYPVLRPLFQEIMGPAVAIVDSAEETAADLARTLAAADLLRRALGPPRHRFVVSDAPDRFRAVAARFLGRPPDAVEQRDVEGYASAA